MLKKLNFQQYKTEILSGLTVAIALLPESIAFAFVAHVHPLVGLYAAFIVALVTSIFGGRPGMISGATGALAVVIVSLVVRHGIEYLFAAVVLMGAIQMLAGVLKLGKFIRIIPHTVMLGFVNGLAIVIFISQLDQLKTIDASGALVWLSGSSLYIMLGLIAVTMGVMYFLGKITKAIPAALGAIIIVFGITQIFGIDTKSVGDMASISGTLPKFHIPSVPFNLETLKIVLPYSLTLAAVGLLESLLTLSLIDEITETKGRKSRECLAQGLANIITGFFGGMGGCAMIGQSMINIKSGARQKLSGIAAALFLLTFMLFGAPVIEKIPLAALTGVMFMVVIGTFAWSSIRIMNKIQLSDAFVIILVSVTTVIFDLAIAVILGVIVSALVYAWESARHITATTTRNKEKDEKVYNLYGPIFFSSAASFRELFDINSDPKNVIINFEHSRIWDHSGIEAIQKLAQRYQAAGKTIRYKGLSEDCASLLGRIGNVVERDSEKDPKYEVVMDHT